jgi:hypothetical protein
VTTPAPSGAALDVHAQHGMRTIGSAPSRWLHFFSPAEIERYFVEPPETCVNGPYA